MNKKIRVAIIFGGRSAEHEVSLQSAKNIINALDTSKYEPILIGIDKQGRWFLEKDAHFLLNESNPKLIALNRSDNEVTLAQGKTDNQLISLSLHNTPTTIDVVFPVLHGPYGEDGTMQGFLKLANLPFVGASVLGSALGMDKDVMKRLLRDGGLPIAKFKVLYRSDVILVNKMQPGSGKAQDSGGAEASLDDSNIRDPRHSRDQNDILYKEVSKKLGKILFIKPANLGSSVGVSKVRSEKEFNEAIKKAFEFDNKILIEEAINGREIECSVLGNENPIASLPGEVIPSHEFYSYNAKYIDENGAKLKIPAELTKGQILKVQKLAIRTFQVLCCEGMARVDFFLKKNGEVLVNEINTIPGFTNISMYPKLWEASGISQTELIDKLIQLAIERFKRDQKLKTSY